MLYIAHRGNIDGPNRILENTPKYIEHAFKEGYDCEIDVWQADKILYLGHDRDRLMPISIDYLTNPHLWVHAKNVKALCTLLDYKTKIQCFYHVADPMTMTSTEFIWGFEPVIGTPRSILVDVDYSNTLATINFCYGVCSDYVKIIKEQNG